MEENLKGPEIYSLPVIIHSSYKLRMHILFLFVTIMFLGVSFLPDKSLTGILIRLLSLVFGALFVYSWFYMGVFKKGYIGLTQDEISLKTNIGFKKLKLKDIVNLQTYCVNNNMFIGMTSKETLGKRKDSFWTSISESMGGGYSLAIPLKSFSKAEPEKLYSTIFYLLQQKTQQECSENKENESIKYTAENNDEETMTNGSLAMTLLKALAISLISGIIYGLIVYFCKVNFLVIPIVGIMGILYVYLKNYKEKGFNLIIRFYIGILCALQFFVALLTELLALNSDFIEANGIWKAISECTINIAQHPKMYMIYYVLAIICFFGGAFWGYSSKTTRRIGKIFMHKQNGFCIKKEKRYISIYTIDYTEYIQNEEKYILRITPNMCLAEKNEKKIVAFYIPEELINNSNMDIKNFKKIFLNEKIYYKLNLGGKGNLQPYGYSSCLILNKYKQVEVIKLEID